MIESLENVLEFVKVSNQYFTINASCNVLMLKYDGGSSTAVTIPDGTYDASSLALALQTAMNTTLTMSGTVTWSSSTKKFTLGAGTGHTLTYTNSGSDAGLLFGFNQDHSAALTLTSDLECGDPTSIVSKIHNAIEAWLKRECRRDFESATYKEVYDGNGIDTLFLKQRPITAITRVAIGRRDVIGIKNTNSYSTASVSVNTTGLILTKDDVSNSDITFASYTTMSAIVTAINALGSGWEAELSNSDYGNFASTNLRPVYGLNCIDDSSSYLYMPDLALNSFEAYIEEGYLYNSGLWTKGVKNIFVDYVAGYSSENMPDDIKMAVCILVKHLYQKQVEETFGLTNFSMGGLSATFDSIGIPIEAKRIINSYKEVYFGEI